MKLFPLQFPISYEQEENMKEGLKSLSKKNSSLTLLSYDDIGEIAREAVDIMRIQNDEDADRIIFGLDHALPMLFHSGLVDDYTSEDMHNLWVARLNDLPVNDPDLARSLKYDAEAHKEVLLNYAELTPKNRLLIDTYFYITKFLVVSTIREETPIKSFEDLVQRFFPNLKEKSPEEKIKELAGRAAKRAMDEVKMAIKGDPIEKLINAGDKVPSFTPSQELMVDAKRLLGIAWLEKQQERADFVVRVRTGLELLRGNLSSLMRVVDSKHQTVIEVGVWEKIALEMDYHDDIPRTARLVFSESFNRTDLGTVDFYKNGKPFGAEEKETAITSLLKHFFEAVKTHVKEAS